MKTEQKIQIGTGLLKALVAGLAKGRANRPTEPVSRQNTNVSGCGGCTRSTHK